MGFVQYYTKCLTGKICYSNLGRMCVSGQSVKPYSKPCFQAFNKCDFTM